MILGLPLADPATDARRAELEKQRAAISAELTHVELRLAADIVRHVFGAAAVWLLVDKATSIEGDTDISLLVVLDGDGKPLWFNSDCTRHDSSDYPGAHDVTDGHGWPIRDMDGEAQAKLIGHLTAAYDATGGVTGAWYPSQDEHWDSDFNVLCLSVPAAFGPYRPAGEQAEPQFWPGRASAPTRPEVTR